MKKYWFGILALFIFCSSLCKAQMVLILKSVEADNVSLDTSLTAKWYLKKAEAGDTLAMFNLGVSYENGHSVTRDYGEAVKWYEKATKTGDASAMANLGAIYENGYGGTKDYGEAMKWNQKAAEAGNARAMFNLGMMFENGYGVMVDFTRALKWFLKSAEAGDAFAMINLGVMYEYSGYGVPHDSAQAVKWCRQAEDTWNKNEHNRITYNVHLLNSYGVFNILVTDIETDSIRVIKRLREANSYLQRACELQPAFTDAWLSRGVAYARLNKVDSTEYCWKRALELNPGDSSLVKQYYPSLCIYLMNTGLNEATNKNFTACINYFYRALNYDKKNADVWYNLGGAYYTIAKYDSARIAWQHCLDLKPDYDKAKQGMEALPQEK